jgi:hypothetical protein
LPGLPAAVVLADHLVDSGHRHDVGLCFKAEMSTTNEIQIERAEKETNIVVKEA